MFESVNMSAVFAGSGVVYRLVDFAEQPSRGLRTIRGFIVSLFMIAESAFPFQEGVSILESCLHGMSSRDVSQGSKLGAFRTLNARTVWKDVNFSRFLCIFFCFSSFNNGTRLSLYAGLFGNFTVASVLTVPRSRVSVTSMKLMPAFMRDLLASLCSTAKGMRMKATYSSQCPLLFFCDPSCFSWAQLDEVQILIFIAENSLVGFSDG